MSRNGRRRFEPQSYGPPQDEPWIWMTRTMLESEAWKAMPLAARKVVERVVLEHMAHGGKMNGELVVTKDNFAAYGIRRPSITEAVRIAIGLGFVDKTVQGVRSFGTARRPSEFALTWLPRRDRSPASNRWKLIGRDKARAIVKAAATSTPPSQDIDSRYESVPRELPQN